MKIVIAPDSYKGAMRAGQVAAAIAEGWRSIRQDDEIVLLPLSDGGEGLCEVLTNGSGGEFVRLDTVDALMRQKSAGVGISGDTAVIESAEANGIEHLAATELNPLRATTAGVGMLLKEVLTRYRCRKVIIGIERRNGAGYGEGYELLCRHHCYAPQGRGCTTCRYGGVTHTYHQRR